MLRGHSGRVACALEPSISSKNQIISHCKCSVLVRNTPACVFVLFRAQEDSAVLDHPGSLPLRVCHFRCSTCEDPLATTRKSQYRCSLDRLSGGEDPHILTRIGQQTPDLEAGAVIISSRVDCRLHQSNSVLVVEPLVPQRLQQYTVFA